MNSSSKGSAGSVLWLLIGAFVFAQYLAPSKDEACKRIVRESRIEFMNHVVLEFNKYGFGDRKNNSQADGTDASTYANKTRIIVNGIVQQIAGEKVSVFHVAFPWICGVLYIPGHFIFEMN